MEVCVWLWLKWMHLSLKLMNLLFIFTCLSSSPFLSLNKYFSLTAVFLRGKLATFQKVNDTHKLWSWKGLLGATSCWIKVKRDKKGDVFLLLNGTEINSHKYSGAITGAIFEVHHSERPKKKNHTSVMPPILQALFAKCPTRAYVLLSSIFSPSCLTNVTVQQDWNFIYIPLGALR